MNELRRVLKETNEKKKKGEENETGARSMARPTTTKRLFIGQTLILSNIQISINFFGCLQCRRHGIGKFFA